MQANLELLAAYQERNLVKIHRLSLLDIHFKDDNGDTVLHHAVRHYTNTDSLRELLIAGAKEYKYTPNKFGKTPIDIANPRISTYLILVNPWELI